MGRAAVTVEPLDLQEMLARPAPEAHGARVVFVGVVRNHAEDRPVRGMRYEGYEPMAREVLQAIVDEAETRYRVGPVEAAHRLGELEIGEASVVIVVSAAHREAAYGASRYVIEEIKKRLPVWKHEHFTDGEDRWVPGTPLQPVEEDREGDAAAGRAGAAGGGISGAGGDREVGDV